MADTAQLPLSLDAAKQNLRDAAEAMSMGQYVKRHPYQTLATAFVVGMLLADDRRASQALLLGSELLRYLPR